MDEELNSYIHDTVGMVQVNISSNSASKYEYKCSVQWSNNNTFNEDDEITVTDFVTTVDSVYSNRNQQSYVPTEW